MRRDIVVSNLVAGAVGLSVLALSGSWPLLVLGVPYVIIMSAFFGHAYRGAAMSLRREVLTWVTPWAVCSLIWIPLLLSIDDGGNSGLRMDLLATAYGVGLAGLLYGSWQLLALFIRTIARGGTIDVTTPDASSR